MQPLKVVIAPSGFKECLSPQETAAAIAVGIRHALPEAAIIELPLADGGEGFTQTMIDQLGGAMFKQTVTGPLGKPVEAYWGLLAGQEKPTAVIEMAAAAGIHLLPKDKRNPLITTTYGVGELLKAALDAGAKKILLGCGDSGTNDAGAGAVQALGVQLLKADNTPIAFGGGSLPELAKIDLKNRDPRLADTEIILVCNINNILCGKQGVSHVFGPQKGATRQDILKLDQSLEHFAALVKEKTNIDVRLMPGGGASGGMGAGLHALLGAKLVNRWDIIFNYFDLEKAMEGADLIITAEGGINFQTPRGKIPAEVARRAKLRNLPVIAIAGSVGVGADLNFKQGIDAIFSILSEPCTLEESIARAKPLLEHAAENVMRAFLAGRNSTLNPPNKTVWR